MISLSITFFSFRLQWLSSLLCFSYLWVSHSSFTAFLLLYNLSSLSLCWFSLFHSPSPFCSVSSGSIYQLAHTKHRSSMLCCRWKLRSKRSTFAASQRKSLACSRTENIRKWFIIDFFVRKASTKNTKYEEVKKASKHIEKKNQQKNHLSGTARTQESSRYCRNWFSLFLENFNHSRSSVLPTRSPIYNQSLRQKKQQPTNKPETDFPLFFPFPPPPFLRKLQSLSLIRPSNVVSNCCDRIPALISHFPKLQTIDVRDTTVHVRRKEEKRKVRKTKA